MDLFEALSAQTHVYEAPAEHMPVPLEPLPAWKQLIVESRQAQTIADLLMEQSKRQITTAKRRIALLSLLRRRLRDSCLWHCTYPISLHFSDDEEKARCFLCSPYEEVISGFSQ